MTKEKLVSTILKKKGYLKSSPTYLSKVFKVSIELAREAGIEARRINKGDLQQEVKPKVVKAVEIKKETPDKFIVNAWDDVKGRLMSIKEYCEHYNFDFKNIKSYKSVTHTAVPYYNIDFKTVTPNIKEVDIKKVVENALSSIKTLPKEEFNPVIIEGEPVADRLIFTDVHIGMEPNPDGKSLFSHKWNAEELFKTADIMMSKVIDTQTADLLIIDDLGDLPDGLGKQTTRGGHALPQNMTDLEVFELGVKFKLHLVETLLKSYSKIVVNNVCEDNHGGIFTAMINSAFKQVVDAKYLNVYVNNAEQFFSHYFIGDHCKILCHGKDSKELKFGMGIKLTPEIASKIEQYIDAYDIRSKARVIEFSKGDSHLCLFDYGNSDVFQYMNYPALSPSSNYIQVNYKKGKRGFVIEHLEKDSSTHNVYWIK